MLEQAITEIQNIRAVGREKNALGSTNSLGFTLLPQGIARVVRRVPPAAREQLGHQSPPGSSSLEIKRLPVGQRQLVEIHDGETEEKSGQGLEGRGDPRPQTPGAVMSSGFAPKRTGQ
jgi:hypothetical protein